MEIKTKFKIGDLVTRLKRTSAIPCDFCGESGLITGQNGKIIKCPLCIRGLVVIQDSMWKICDSCTSVPVERVRCLVEIDKNKKYKTFSYCVFIAPTNGVKGIWQDVDAIDFTGEHLSRYVHSDKAEAELIKLNTLEESKNGN